MYENTKTIINKLNRELEHEFKVIERTGLCADDVILCDKCMFKATLKIIFGSYISYKTDSEYDVTAIEAVSVFIKNKNKFLCKNIIINNILK